jgi:hypothetical protein
MQSKFLLPLLHLFTALVLLLTWLPISDSLFTSPESIVLYSHESPSHSLHSGHSAAQLAELHRHDAR